MTTFALDLDKAIEKAMDQAELVVRAISINLFKNVIMKSPVDTGRFRANWNCALVSPDYSVSNNTDKAGSGTVTKMTSKVLQHKLEDGSLFLTNNLPYAMRLEYGHSQEQAPHGMVRVSMMEVNRKYGA